MTTPPPPPPRLTARYQVSADGYPAVSSVLMSRLSEGFPPALAVRVCTSEGSPYAAAGGWARLAGPESVPARADTLFDLASLTKVVVTLPLVLLLHQRGLWSIDDPVARWLPGAPRSPVTISQCLLHVAGLVPHRPYHETCAGPAEIRRAVIAELADAEPGPISYSDLGFMLLGWAVEECAGEPLADLAAREVLGPLGMASTGYLPQAPLARVAATEADGDQRAGSGVVWGSVHDGNAFALGGVSGHAGLFGTAGDLGRYVSALLTPDRHPVLSTETLALMTARRAGTGAEARVLGWRLNPDAWGSWPDGTLWHTGFTGTSLLIAPALDVAVVLLTNAVHPIRRLDQTSALRASVHRAIRDAAGLSGNGLPGVRGPLAPSTRLACRRFGRAGGCDAAGAAVPMVRLPGVPGAGLCGEPGAGAAAWQSMRVTLYLVDAVESHSHWFPARPPGRDLRALCPVCRESGRAVQVRRGFDDQPAARPDDVRLDALRSTGARGPQPPNASGRLECVRVSRPVGRDCYD